MYLPHRGVCGVFVLVGVLASSKCCGGVGTAAGQLHPSVGGESLKANDLCSPLSFILLVYLLHSVFIQIYLLQTSAFASSKCICFTQVYLLPMCIFFPSVFASLECECWLKTDDLSTGLGSPICFIQVYLLPKCISFPSTSSKYICVWLLHLSVFASSECRRLVKDR